MLRLFLRALPGPQEPVCYSEGVSVVVTIQATTAASFRVGMKTLCRTALRKTVFGGEAHKLRQSKSARANFGRHLRSRSLVDCAKPQPWSFARRAPLHLHCQGCELRGSGAGGGIARTDPRKSWDRTHRTASLHCVSCACPSARRRSRFGFSNLENRSALLAALHYDTATDRQAISLDIVVEVFHDLAQRHETVRIVSVGFGSKHPHLEVRSHQCE